MLQVPAALQALPGGLQAARDAGPRRARRQALPRQPGRQEEDAEGRARVSLAVRALPRRELTAALAVRQGLAQRHRVTPAEAVRRLTPLLAQHPPAPYLA